MSRDGPDPDPPELDPSPTAPPLSSLAPPRGGAGDPGDPLGDLPRVARRHARLAMRLGRAGEALQPLLDEVAGLIGSAPLPGAVEVIPSASGLRRPGVIARFSWPRLGTRVGLGVEPSVAHAIVDRLLGFERAGPEHKLQVSPVELGVLGFVVSRLLDRLAERPGALGPWDLAIDRIGPEPFRPEGLGAIVTLSWAVRVGPASGSVRLWVPEVLAALALVDEPPPPPLPDDRDRRFGGLVALGRLELGTVSPPGGPAGLRAGAELPVAPVPIPTPPDVPGLPAVLAFGDESRRWVVPAAVEPDSGGARLTVLGPISLDPIAQEPLAVPPSTDPSATLPGTESAAGVPISLVVELGRLSLPLARLADLKPGDLVELPRGAGDPVDLTSGGTLVARGELVRVDSGLGVRLTRVFL